MRCDRAHAGRVSRSRLLALLLAAALAASGCLRGDDGGGPSDGGSDGDGPDGGEGGTGNGSLPVALHRVADGFSQPLLVTHAGDGSGRLFVAEQPGRIQVVAPDGGVSLYGDLTDRVGSDGSEQGLLGIAFHPTYPESGVVIVSYTDTAGTSTLSRFQEAGGVLDPQSEEILLVVMQPFANHNGGHIVYGPDGMLYLGLGDGGLAGDPNLNGQNPATLLGSILRLDVGTEGAYTTPSDNPFAGDPAGADEVWVYGLRNPWRFSFDVDGGLWIGDVGQDAFEEVTRLPAGEQAGANLGWNLFEGDHQYPTGLELPVSPEVLVFPDVEYTQDPHCSVTGGHVVRDPALGGQGGLEGQYVYGDFCSGVVWALGDAAAGPSVLLEAGFPISSFGEGEDGGLYVVDYGGAVLRFVPA